MTAIISVTARDELRELVQRTIAQQGSRCDLNHIDVSRVEDFTAIFRNTTFNGNIDRWDTRAMRSAMGMFVDCPFNGDISRWNTSNLRNATSMFAHSEFNGDISQWDVSRVETMARMFEGSWFRGDISPWQVSEELIDVRRMFKDAVFGGDLSPWKLRHDCDVSDMVDHHFTGALPRPESGGMEAYQRMMGSFFHFVHYLKRVGMNPTSIACMMDYANAPAWIEENNYQWVQTQKSLGRGLGLFGQDLFAMVVQNAKLKMANDDLALDNPGFFA